ncbi:MAG: hypothetical protein NWP69_05735 [Congregibacter sp.]|nr:hypothetical protein [Congregibacter sp.]MDP5070902.1 hypothetical protein [Congregibacter sp.]
MASLRQWFGEFQQRMLTRLANRSFRKNPNFIDRLATAILKKLIGETPHDPELDHPEA